MGISFALPPATFSSQSVTNSHRPPRNSLFLHNHGGLAGELLPAFLVPPVVSSVRSSQLAVLLVCLRSRSLCSHNHILCCSPERKKKTPCHYSAPVATFLHPTYPASECAGNKTRQSHSIPVSCQQSHCSHPGTSKYSRDASCAKGLLWKTLWMLEKWTKKERKEKKNLVLAWKPLC